MMDVGSPAMPDIEELRMLRALVYEGAALARHGRYVARFHRWIVEVSREGRCSAAYFAPITVEIRYRHGELLERTYLVVDDVWTARQRDEGARVIAGSMSFAQEMAERLPR